MNIFRGKNDRIPKNYINGRLWVFVDLQVSFTYLQMTSQIRDTYHMSSYRGMKSNQRHYEAGKQKIITKLVSAHSPPLSTHIARCDLYLL